MRIKNLKIIFPLFLFGGLLATSLICSSCGGTTTDGVAEKDSLVADDSVITVEYDAVEGQFHHKYIVADQKDEKHIYKKEVNKANCFVVISKREYRLYVYEAAGKDTNLVASFPICYAIQPGQKHGEGDNSTPECTMKNPFKISEIKDATTWTFDFTDGRGPILAFGRWFHRLDLSQSFPDNPAVAANRSIGIHGSTGNEASIPGRDSHGCIRMYDADLDFFHDNYAQVGTPIIIKSIAEKKYPFEIAAEEKLGDKYVAPQKGNPILKKTSQKTEPADNTTASEETKPSAEPETSASPEGRVVGQGSGETGASATSEYRP